jgi:acetyltransferase-like isoleucine patch superfamily enzyme
MLSFLFKKIISFYAQPLSRKKQYLENGYLKIKGILLYRFLFKKFGKGSILRSPLFISYESLEVGKNVFIWDDARIEAVDRHSDTKFTPTIILGDGVSIEQRCHITAADELVIGKNTVLLFDVMVTDIDHEYQGLILPIKMQPFLVAKTTIGENCFIGSGAKINAGTTLGKHCVVGANAFVRGNFPDYCVIVGIPGKIVKRYNIETKLWQKTDAQGRFI